MEENGQLSNIKLVRDIGGGCGLEAVRVVELMNSERKWEAYGKARGSRCPVQFNVPVKFRME